jgi:hypothetical protein
MPHESDAMPEMVITPEAMKEALGWLFVYDPDMGNAEETVRRIVRAVLNNQPCSNK